MYMIYKHWRTLLYKFLRVFKKDTSPVILNSFIRLFLNQKGHCKIKNVPLTRWHNVDIIIIDLFYIG